MRYIIVDKEMYGRTLVRFVYDTKYKTFAIVHKRTSDGWKNAKYIDENFYIYYPGFAENSRESDTLPNWKVTPNANANRINRSSQARS